MDLLSIIDKLYENDNFATVLIIAIIFLVILFIIVLLMGIKDAKASKEPKKEVEEDVKDITFEPEVKEPPVKEDVTFEMPVLTKNLEEFKKNFEEEIQKEQEVEVRTTSHNSLSESTKPVKILDINAIEDTNIINSPLIESTTEEKKPEYKSEEKIKEDIPKLAEEKKKNTDESSSTKIPDDKLHFIDDDEF